MKYKITGTALYNWECIVEAKNPVEATEIAMKTFNEDRPYIQDAFPSEIEANLGKEIKDE